MKTPKSLISIIWIWILRKANVFWLPAEAGAGKTTLTRCINGLVPHYYEGKIDGQVLVYDIDVYESEIHDIAFNVGTVFQDPRSQFFTTNTTNEIAFGMENVGTNRDMMHKKIHRVVKELDINELLNRSVFSISNGEKQKIAIASVCAMEPKVIIFDEPSANLDVKSIWEIRELIRKLKEKGHTIIINEHRLYYLIGVVDKVLYIDVGRVANCYSENEFIGLSADEFKAKGLRTYSFNDFKVDNIDNIQINPNRKCMLQADGVSVKIKDNNILNNISFSAYSGEVIGIIGDNGSGKTTLVKALCGLIKENSGQIEINGKVPKSKNRKKSTYYVMQDSDYQLFSDTVISECLLGLEKKDWNGKKSR